MKVELTIDDELYEKLRKNCGAKKDERALVSKEIKRVLAEFADVGTDGRYFVVEGKDRQALEKVFQTTISTAAELIQKVQNMSIFGIGDATRPLTDGESIQLASQASFWGQTPAEFIKTTMDRVLDETLGRI
jgi:hypothetical protein